MATNPNVEISRDRYIGGSDIPIILGISPFKTRWRLLQEKAGIIEAEKVENPYIDYGNTMEAKIRGFINYEMERQASVENCYRVDEFVEGTFTEEHPVIGIRCNVDGYNEDKILEIKTTSHIYEKLEDYEVYLAQVIFYLMHSDREDAILAVYERPKDFDTTFNANRLHIYSINLKNFQDLANRINNEVEKFTNDLQKLKDNPWLTEEELQPKELTTLSAELEQIENQLKSLKDLEEKEQELKAKLFKVMTEYNVKSWETPNGVKITRVDPVEGKVTIKKVFNESKFKADNEELYNKYLENKETKGRTIVGYVKITTKEE